MDKYTVDLDQVLNDFEYSELTDQHSRNVPERLERPRDNFPFQPAPATKHSMNNVFHSLNEYLNSGTGSTTLSGNNDTATLGLNDNNLHFNKPEEVNDIELQSKRILESLHKLTEEIPTLKPKYGLQPIETASNDQVIINFDDPKTNVDSNKTEIPDFSLLATENVISETIPEQCTEILSESESCDGNNDDPECDRNGIDKADSLLVDDNVESNDLNENEDNVLININEDIVKSVEDFVIEAQIEPIIEPDVCGLQSNFENSISDSGINDDCVGGPLEELNAPYLEKDEEVVEDQNLIPTEREQVMEKEILEANKVSEVLDEKEQLAHNETLENNEEIKDDLTVNSLLPSNIIDKPEIQNDVPQIISFSADIDIDESDLNKMLEDLELEAQGELEGVNKSTSMIQEPGMEVPKEEMQNDVPNPNLQNQAAKSEVLEENPLECLEMEKPVKPRKKYSAKVLNSNKSTTTTVPENLEQQSECVKINVEKTGELEEASAVEKTVKLEVHSDNGLQESSTRPQDLPLNNEVKEDNVGRKINLIGSPGSTPYNNVYMNKSVEPKTQHHNHDIESDCTSSASPTFSDCSTESTSTASTVSVEDSAEKVTKKNPSDVKNINNELSNKEVAENVLEENVENTAHPKTDAPVLNENYSAIGDGDSQEQNSTSNDAVFDMLGKEAPLWIPDADAAACLHCDMKFTVLKRRHHCRACGLVLCSKCCHLKFRLEYLDSEARVCNKCHDILNKDTPNNAGSNYNSPESGNSPAFRPNPNNPLEYCSTVSPLQQAGLTGAPPPSVMVPVGVLKRKGPDEVKKIDETTTPPPSAEAVPSAKISRNQPKVDEFTGCFIPKNEMSLPPTVVINKTEILYSDHNNGPSVVKMLKDEPLTFAINPNLFVQVKVINMSCCINKQAWCFCTDGLINVGSDEIVYLIEYIEDESFVPSDVFFHLNNVYNDAVKGASIKELGLSLHNTSNFLDSKNHAGFVYIKATFQCLENLILPKEPYLIGILIHRWETPWAKLFPLRLILRLGAQYRYYPSPLISSRHRDSVFVEIGHTIINLLADFRNFTYSLPQIRGLIIHMEDKNTTIIIPRNRYDQVMKTINDSSEHILAFAGNFSSEADSHLVCIQDTQGHENIYTTHAINIHSKPRKVTGASFIVFNGSLKSTSGLSAKSSIIEDGLMIQVPPDHMDKIRDTLRKMKDHTIPCGCLNADSDESVNIIWGENDTDFNVGVTSPVDLQALKGIPSIRVHNGKDYPCTNGTRLIRWTEVFIWQNGEENPKNQDPVDISKVSESIAKACCTALVKYLDLLVSNSFQKIGVRTTLHVDNVSYSAGSNGLKLPPIYMRSLDNELIPVLHRISSNNLGDNAIVLELVFRILNA
ncbi:unnamed protein product [Ceutorhynchus assimilis]|uniref:FYVE-type domain-containing protein n=1 Tax=Ceutorhynchus assimilis TaxID=467358 RepID=A0A9P0DER1_9CUCU|nr:unnamed protein product [Ceutorhynchus assimilis]